MKIQKFLNLVDSLSTEAIWRKVDKCTWQIYKRIVNKIIGSSITPLRFMHDLIPEISDKSNFLNRIKLGPFPKFFIDDQKKEWTANQFLKLFPGEEINVIKAAEKVCDHVFELLGSKPYNFGKEIDWQLDFESGYRWDENQFYRKIKPASYPGGYDIKIPWELSRFQHFVWLGQAYWFSNNETFAEKFKNQIEHWSVHNLPQLGVNWVCTMDVAIRAINWLWGYAFFRHSPSLSDEFHVFFYRTMLEHGRHIFHNLEYYETLTSNHYLSNLVGLIYLGILLPELKEAKKWKEYGIKELETEMLKQVYPDGINFEASTNYHRLATELFLSSTILAQLNGEKFSDEYIKRLERMIEVLGVIMKPDGTTPVIGDQDNGRLHRLKIWNNPLHEWIDFRPLFISGKVWSQKPIGINVDKSIYIEAFWLLGPKAIREFINDPMFTNPKPIDSMFYPYGGWLVMRDRDNYLFLDVGPVGQNEIGGHSHNDTLSIEVFSDRQSWVVDPGTYTYTNDYKTRHMFRQTKSHNTVYLPGFEQSLLDEKIPFKVTKPSNQKVLHWEENRDYNLFAAEVEYASNPIITHKRLVMYAFEAETWLIGDQLLPERSDALIHFTFASGVKTNPIVLPYPGIQLENDLNKSFYILSLNGENPEISTCWVSSSYGVKQESHQAEFHFSGYPFHFLALIPTIKNVDLNKRLNLLTGKIKFLEKLFSDDN